MRSRTSGVYLVVVAALVLLPFGCKSEKNKYKGRTIVKLETSKGDIVIEVNETAAPVTAANFMKYVQEGFYDGTIFHRVKPNFMIQGGGFAPDMKQKPTRPPIINEAKNGLKNKKGAVAMARLSDPNSATAQFYMNTTDNYFLDYGNPRSDGFGYCVFGQVVEGMDVVEAIGKTKTGIKGMFQDVPVDPIIIKSAKMISKK
jgi:peptidyl-prolyl cis-trans isomerase B (cyclophilin B)